MSPRGRLAIHRFPRPAEPLATLHANQPGRAERRVEFRLREDAVATDVGAKPCRVRFLVGESTSIHRAKLRRQELRVATPDAERKVLPHVRRNALRVNRKSILFSFEVHLDAVRDGHSCGLEPRLKMRRFAMRAESRNVSKGWKVYERENSRVSRSARSKDFYLFLTNEDFREMLVSFSWRRNRLSILTRRSIHDPVMQHKRTCD
jgi:hypothetical protein